MGLLAIVRGRAGGLVFLDFLGLEYATGPLSVNEAVHYYDDCEIISYSNIQPYIIVAFTITSSSLCDQNCK